MWKFYDLKMRFRDRLMGGIPKNPDLIGDWLKARMPSDAAIINRRAAGETISSVETLAKEVEETIEAVEERAWTGFQSDDNGLFVRQDHVKAHLKDCANVLRGLAEVTAFRSKVADRVFPEPPRIYLYSQVAPAIGINEGDVFSEPDGYWEHPVHVMTPRGKRSALKRTDYVSQPMIRLNLRVLDDKTITEKHLRDILEYGSVHGFGAERSLGNGQYEFTLTAQPEAVEPTSDTQA